MRDGEEGDGKNRCEKVIAETKELIRIQSYYDGFSLNGSITSFSSPLLNDTLTLTEVSVLKGNWESCAKYKGR